MPGQFSPYKVNDLTVNRFFGVSDQGDEIGLRLEQVRTMLNIYSPIPGELCRRKGSVQLIRMPVRGRMNKAIGYFDCSVYCVGRSVLVEDV